MSRNMGKYSATNYQASKLSVYPILLTLQSSIGSQISRKTGLSVSKFLQGKKEENSWVFFFFCRWWRMVQATKRPEKKNALTERSRQLYLRFRWNYRRFYPLITISSRAYRSGIEKEVCKLDNELFKYRLSLWRRCCLTKGLVVFKRKSAKKQRPS